MNQSIDGRRGTATSRILFVNHSAVMGGGEMSLLDIARHFRATSEVILLAEGPFQERLAAAGVQVEVIALDRSASQVSRSGGLLHDLRAVPEILRVAREIARRGRCYDLLYANSLKAMIMAGVAGLMARRPVIWHLRDLMSEEHFSGLHRWIAALMAKGFAHRVIANSSATGRALVEAGGPADRIAVVHNGVDTKPFGPTLDAEANALRTSLALDGVPVVGVFGRLAQWKGQHVLLEALTDMPSVHGLLVGDALFEGDRDYARQLREQVAQLGLERRVRFLGHRSDVPSVMRMCDVVAHTSVAPEPFGRVIVEGMLAGRPVVASRAGGALEIIEDGRTGCLVPPGDGPTLARALRMLLDERDEAQALAERGRAAARERFSLDAMLSGIEAEIARVTRGADARAA